MSGFHYQQPHQMTPMMPGDRKLEELHPLAASLIDKSLRLPAQALPQVRVLLCKALLLMNAYYTNKIEGQHTTPQLIQAALENHFVERPDVAQKQRIAVAHIETERWGVTQLPHYDGRLFYSDDFVRQIHRHLYSLLPPEDREQNGPEGSGMAKVVVIPGEYRECGVKVGQHVPPAPRAIPAFLDAWQKAYVSRPAGEYALIGLAASHHRLTWIHPFVDGNGRTARMHTLLGLNALGLTNGLWSPLRGLARDTDTYFSRLIGADRERQGATDGRGVLSERGLIEFVRYFLELCHDQVDFMERMLNLSEFPERLRVMLAAEAARQRSIYLRPEAVIPLHYLGTVPSLERGQFKAMLGLQERTADRVLAQLFQLGIITSASPRGPVELAIPIKLWRYLFPRLWPEAEAGMD